MVTMDEPQTMERSVSTMKRMILFLLCLLLLASCLPTFAGAEGAAFRSPQGIPDAVLEFFSDRSFDGYTIGLHGYTEAARAGYGYAFVLAQKDGRNVLYGFRSSGQQGFRHFLTTDSAVPQGQGVFRLQNIGGQVIETYPSAESAVASGHYTLSDAAIAIRFQVPDNEEYDNWTLYADCDDSGQWRVRWIFANGFGTKYSEARLTDSGLTAYFELVPQGSAQGVVETSLRYFSWDTFPKSLQEAQDKLTNPPSIPSGELKAQRVQFTGGRKYEVYTGPGPEYLRAGSGKAAVSTNDWIQVFGSENGYLLIQYDISASRNRFGYIPESALPNGASVGPLPFRYEDATVLANTVLTDDPLNSRAALCTLSGGDSVKWLAAMGDWVYVEAESYGQPVRGFAPLYTVSRILRIIFTADYRNAVYSAQATVEVVYEHPMTANIAVTVTGPASWKNSGADRVIGYQVYANNLPMEEVSHAVGYISQNEIFALSTVLPAGAAVLGLCPIHAQTRLNAAETITVVLQEQ